MSFKYAAFALTYFSLAACGSSEPTGFTDRVNALEALALEAEGVIETSGAAIPSGGTAVYRGSMLGSTSTEAYAGALTMNANFGGSSIDGSVTDIYDSAERRVAGSLTIAPTSINRLVDPLLDPQFVTTMGGTLVDADGVTLSVSGDVDGGFGGPAAEYVGVIASGTVSSGVYGPESFYAVGLAKR